ncbi:hypothetical protein PEP31012_00849 [Pandoraea eparura]|uniref:Uncharacterized protein n=1 Tax=Pandoraea eparura TaxID=2508291 RepID=A0A5E4SNX9_9BURK|nr:hypothetical protein [Pandoraea eparura]VVD76108.1 hypothetical protein PEP31012_00849 [Pandoraea eparura]
MYQLYITEGFVTRLSDGATIPMADGNVDYEEFKRWQAEGNVPDPADPVPVIGAE